MTFDARWTQMIVWRVNNKHGHSQLLSEHLVEDSVDDSQAERELAARQLWSV